MLLDVDTTETRTDLLWLAPAITIGFAILLVVIALVLRRASHNVDWAMATKIQRVASLSEELQKLNAQIQSEFAAQIVETEKLKQQAEDSKNIASMNAEAVAGAKAILNANKWPERRFQILVAVGGLLAGIGGTLLLQAITGR